MADEGIAAGDFLFVYGTLRKGERASLQNSAKNFSVTFICNSKINGEMFHIGAYPGVKLLKGQNPELFIEELPTVIGETFLVRDPSIGAVLDSYEGYPNLYDRLPLRDIYGRMAWTYLFNPPVTRDQLIETGDWKNPRISGTHRIPVI